MTTNKTYEVHAPSSGSSHFLLKLCRILGMIIMWFFLLLLNIWAVAALYVDCRIPALRIPLIIVYLAILILLVAKVRQHRALSSLICFTVVLVWWLSLKPSDDWRVAGRCCPKGLGRDLWRPDNAAQCPKLRLSIRDRIHKLLERPDVQSFRSSRCRFLLHQLGSQVDRPPHHEFRFRQRPTPCFLHRGPLQAGRNLFCDPRIFSPIYLDLYCR